MWVAVLCPDDTATPARSAHITFDILEGARRPTAEGGAAGREPAPMLPGGPVTPTAIRTVAVLSDIHGVASALDAVLAEPDVAAAERIVRTGDIAAGPQPVDVLDRLVDLDERVVWVRGNADRELVTRARGGTTSIPDPIAPWAAQAAAVPARGAAGRPAAPRHAAARGFGAVLFCHGTPP